MQFSTKHTINASVSSSSKSVLNNRKETFLGYIVRKFNQAFRSIWRYSGKFLWVSSTALLVVILPFAFAYLLEIQAELMKMQASTLIVTKWTVDSTKCEHHDHNHLLFLKQSLSKLLYYISVDSKCIIQKPVYILLVIIKNIGQVSSQNSGWYMFICLICQCLQKYILILAVIYSLILINLMSDLYCVNCTKFFGNPTTLNMCSVCYKQEKQIQTIKHEATNIKIPQIPENVQPKQADHSRCFSCKKKVGLLGLRCKGCDCTYCNGHRLPEDHKCDGNFMEMAKNQIKKNNPNITAPKIQKI